MSLTAYFDLPYKRSVESLHFRYFTIPAGIRWNLDNLEETLKYIQIWIYKLTLGRGWYCKYKIMVLILFEYLLNILANIYTEVYDSQERPWSSMSCRWNVPSYNISFPRHAHSHKDLLAKSILEHSGSFQYIFNGLEASITFFICI